MILNFYYFPFLSVLDSVNIQYRPHSSIFPKHIAFEARDSFKSKEELTGVELLGFQS